MAQVLEHLKTLAKDEVGALTGPSPAARSERQGSGWLGAGSFWKETFT